MMPSRSGAFTRSAVLVAFAVTTGFAAILAATPASAQTAVPAPRGGIRLELGLRRHGQTDLMASPLRYRGTAPDLGLGFRHVRRDTRFDLEASFSAVTLESDISRTGSGETAYFARLRLRWLHRVAARMSWEGFLGGRVDVFVPVRRHTYPLGGGTELYGDAFIPIQLAAAQELRLTPRTVAREALAVPVAAVVLRSPYTGLKYLPDADLAPPGRLIGLEHTLGVDRTLSRHEAWTVSVEWRVALLRYPEPRKLAMVTHRLTLGLEVRP